MGVEICDSGGKVLCLLNDVGEAVSFGRDKKQCKILFPADAAGVSRVHARIELAAHNAIVVRDSSTYGTSVDGEMIQGKEKKMTLKNNITIVIGMDNSYNVRLEGNNASNKGRTDGGSSSRIGNEVVDKRLSEPVTTTTKRNMMNTQSKMTSFFSDKTSQRKPGKSQDSSDIVLAEDTPDCFLDSNSATSISSRTIVADSASSPKNQDTVRVDNDEESFVRPMLNTTSTILSNKRKLPSPTEKENTVTEKAKKAAIVKKEEEVPSPFPSQLGSVFNTTTKRASSSLFSFRPAPISTGIIDLDNDDVEIEMQLPLRTQRQSSTTSKQTTQAQPSPISINPLATRKRSANSTPFDMAPTSSFDAPVEPAPKRRGRPPTSQNVKNTQQIVEEITTGDVVTTKKEKVAPKKRGPATSKTTGDMIYLEDNTVSSTAADSEINPDHLAKLLNDLSGGKKSLADDSDEEEEVEDEEEIKRREMNIKKVVKKLKTVVKYADLEKKSQPIPSRQWSNETTVTSEEGGVNFKKFKKANQGRFNHSIASSSSNILGGSADLADFRTFLRH